MFGIGKKTSSEQTTRKCKLCSSVKCFFEERRKQEEERNKEEMERRRREEWQRHEVRPFFWGMDFRRSDA